MHARHLNTLLRIVFLRMNCKNVDNHVTQFWTVLSQSTHWIQPRNVCTQHDKLTAFLVMIQNLNSKGAVWGDHAAFRLFVAVHFTFYDTKTWVRKIKTNPCHPPLVNHIQDVFPRHVFPTKPLFPLPACSACFHVWNVRLVLFNSCESFVWDAIAAPGDRNKGVK